MFLIFCGDCLQQMAAASNWGQDPLRAASSRFPAWLCDAVLSGYGMRCAFFCGQPVLPLTPRPQLGALETVDCRQAGDADSSASSIGGFILGAIYGLVGPGSGGLFFLFANGYPCHAINAFCNLSR